MLTLEELQEYFIIIIIIIGSLVAITYVVVILVMTIYRFVKGHRAKLGLYVPFNNHDHIWTGFSIVTCGSRTHTEVTACDLKPNLLFHLATEDMVIV